MKSLFSSKGLAGWLFILALCFLLFTLKPDLTNPKGTKDLSYSEWIQTTQLGQVKNAVIEGDKITGELLSGEKYKTNYLQMDLQFVNRLEEARKVNPNFTYQIKEPSQIWSILLTYWLPTILLIVFLYFIFFRQVQGAGNKAFSFGKSRPRLFSDGNTKVTFTDVAGVEEAKQELREIIDFLVDPGKFTKLGARIPKGVLLVGPPGTGKTLLAKAVAGEANRPFFSISGSDFVEMFVGVGASRVRDLFDQGRRAAPCIIFIDELDAVGRHRGAGLGGGHDEREQTLNALLVEMDGFDSKEGIIIMAATNRPDVLDPALLRPGRFDRRVVVDLPDLEGRLGILEVHSKKVPLDPAVDLRRVAQGTPFFSGADLANLINEAALLAGRQNKKTIEMPDLEEARDKVMMGPERKSRKVSEKEKEIIAYHESGHALVGKLLPDTDPVHKVTLVPRGTSYLGATFHLPERDKYLKDKSEYENDLVMLLGGRVAEELVFGEITGGASNDLKRATETAHNMVCKWGMSEKLGPLTYGETQDHIFLGKEFARERNYSEETSTKIDAEIRSIVLKAHERATSLLKANRELLDRLAKALMDREVLDGDEVDKIIRGEELPPKVFVSPTGTPPSVPTSPEVQNGKETVEEPIPVKPHPSPA